MAMRRGSWRCVPQAAALVSRAVPRRHFWLARRGVDHGVTDLWLEGQVLEHPAPQELLALLTDGLGCRRVELGGLPQALGAQVGCAAGARVLPSPTGLSLPRSDTFELWIRRGPELPREEGDSASLCVCCYAPTACGDCRHRKGKPLCR